MEKSKREICRQESVAKLVVQTTVLMSMASGTAHAFELNLSPDWAAHWDNTISYNLGIRAQGINPNIGNNPLTSESDYKFAHAGDVVTNKVSNLTEFDAVYKDRYGFRVSASMFKDFAFGSGVSNNPGEAAPGVPYSILNSYANNRFSSYTERYYSQGIQLLDAFAFGRFDVGGHNTTIKFGQLTQFWGNALFFGTQGIDYSQNASDGIKGSGQPGTQAKELALPRFQALLTTEITPALSVEGQYFLRSAQNLLPEGGTYLGTEGFLFSGPQYLLGSIPHGGDIRPSNTNPNFGIKTTWSPDWLRGSVSLYYRRLDETQPWVLFGQNPQTGATNYHLSYATNVHLYGVSLEKQIGDYSTGFEISYREHTGLNSVTGPGPGDPQGTQGARGNVLNVIGNVVAGLTPTPLWQTGTITAEMSGTHLTSVTSNPSLYNGTNNAAACPSGNKWSGCSTTNSVMVAAQFDPTWLQVYPGVDLDMPIFAMYGLYGNTPSLGAPVSQGSLVYTIGLHALVQNKYNVTLQYNGYHAHTSGGLTNFGNVPVGTPGFPSYYAGGNGAFFYNDKPWVSLTMQMSF